MKIVMRFKAAQFGMDRFLQDVERQDLNIFCAVVTEKKWIMLYNFAVIGALKIVKISALFLFDLKFQ